MLSRRVLVGGGTAILLTGALGACTRPADSAAQNNPPAPELWKKAWKHAQAAKSVHIDYSYSTKSGDSVQIEISGYLDGTNTRTIVTQNGLHSESRTVGGSTYIRADEKFWDAVASSLPKQKRQLLASSWVKVPDPRSSMRAELWLNSLKEGELEKLNSQQAVVRRVDFEGISAFEIGIPVEPTAGRMWVSRTGAGRLLALESTNSVLSPSAQARIVFSRWNEIAAVRVPKDFTEGKNQPTLDDLKLPAQTTPSTNTN